MSSTAVGFHRGTQAQIDTLSTFLDGQFYVATDTGRMYLGQSDGSKLQLNDGERGQTPTFTFSTSEPTSSDGSDGDVWMVYEE